MPETLINVDQFQESPTEGSGNGGNGGNSGSPLTPAPPTDGTPSIPIIPPALPPATPTPRPTVNLLTGVTINKLDIHSIYTKGSGMAIPSDSFVITNTFPDLTVLISMIGITGVTFSPNVFDLHPNESKEVAVSFDRTQIENLPEGVSTVTVGIELSSTLPTYVSPPVIVPPPDPVPTPVIYWINGIDGSYNVGNPPAGWHQTENGMWLPPSFPVPNPTPVDPTPPPITISPQPPTDGVPSIPIDIPRFPVDQPELPAPSPIFRPAPPTDRTPFIPIDFPRFPVDEPVFAPAPPPTPIYTPTIPPAPTPVPEPTPEPLPPEPEPPFEEPIFEGPTTSPIFPRFKRPAK